MYAVTPMDGTIWWVYADFNSNSFRLNCHYNTVKLSGLCTHALARTVNLSRLYMYQWNYLLTYRLSKKERKQLTIKLEIFCSDGSMGGKPAKDCFHMTGTCHNKKESIEHKASEQCYVSSAGTTLSKLFTTVCGNMGKQTLTVSYT